jgi:hypothetical protein
MAVKSEKNEEFMTDLEEDPVIDGGLPDPEELEVKTAPEDEVEVEVVDDTPPEDRNREPMTEDPEPTKDELASYSEKVQARISKLQRAYHDERRAKEQFQREQQEAVRYAQQVSEYNKKLATQTASSKKLLHDTWKSKTESELAQAKSAYKAAYESGDSEALTEAQEALNRAVIRHEQAITEKPVEENSLQPDLNAVKNTQDTQSQQGPDENAKAWVAKNPWFSSDEEMRGTVFGIHERLLKSGVHPVRDASKYYEEIDRTMRKRYPDYNWGDKQVDKPGNKPRAKPATVVAPVTRTSKGQKVVLTQTQVTLAKRLNIPLQEYARQQALLNNQGGQ